MTYDEIDFNIYNSFADQEDEYNLHISIYEHNNEISTAVGKVMKNTPIPDIAGAGQFNSSLSINF
ncbi:MAG: hypothetical protein ACW98K_14775 [Candidatus Kariarchaeaceae archaeon]|jgi:hypothetical protein